MAANILSRPKLGHGLEVLVNRKIKADAGNELVRPIQQNCITALWIAVEDVAEVGRHVNILTQPSIDKSDQAKITNVRSGTRAPLQHIKAGRRLVGIPAIEGYDANAQRVVGTRHAPFGAGHKRAERRLAIQSIDERSIRQVRRRHRKGDRHHNRALSAREPRRTAVTRQRRARQRHRREH